MNDSKCAKILTVLVMTALVAVSFSAIMLSDDAAAEDPTYVNNFSDLESALKRGDKIVIMTDDITLKTTIIVQEGQRLIVHDRCTLTIPHNVMLAIFGHVTVGGSIVNKGDILMMGSSPYQVILTNGTIEGSVMLELPDISMAQTGNKEFTFPYPTGINDDTVNLTVKTYSAAPGKYKYDTKMSDGKYTTSYDNGDNKYKCSTHLGGTFTIVSETPSEGFEIVSTFADLKKYLNNNPQGLVQVGASFEVNEPLTIAKGQEVELLKDKTMTITDTGSICNEGAFTNHGTLDVTNGSFYQKQYRYSAFYNFGTVNGKVGLSYDDIETLYRHVDMYDIRMFPTYDIYHPIVLNCTPYDTEGTSFTYTEKANPGPGEYTIEIVNDYPDFDYYIHDAGKLILDKYDMGPAPDSHDTGDKGAIIAFATVAIIILVIAIAMVAVKKD